MTAALRQKNLRAVFEVLFSRALSGPAAAATAAEDRDSRPPGGK